MAKRGVSRLEAIMTIKAAVLRMMASADELQVTAWPNVYMCQCTYCYCHVLLLSHNILSAGTGRKTESEVLRRTLR